MVGKFDYVMANPPFNVNRIDKERIKNDRRRFPFGMPSVDNGNYLWIQLFYSALMKEDGQDLLWLILQAMPVSWNCEKSCSKIESLT